MLPLPGSPASSWAMYKARIKAAFEGADPRVCTAFWLFGLINNVLYVIILSAALDLVGPSVPKGVVLLCDIIPSFLVKLCAPYFIHTISYPIRIIIFVTVPACGMLLIALTPAYTDGGTIATKMAGVILASLGSGAGELSFLGLTHFYGPFSLASWGSGTGGAGLIGAGAYALATTSAGLSSRATLLASSFLPIIMLMSFFLILPRRPLSRRKASYESRQTPSNDNESSLNEDDYPRAAEDEGLLNQEGKPVAKAPQNWQAAFAENLRRSRSLFFP
ncbi:battenin CLN3 protein [Mycoblastus sanguinarius]|nr:battenin CLN3 protein [Mycoblastus sanguinarius]